jgi:ribosomal protein S27E
MTKPRPMEDTHVEIRCVDCGKPRMVRNQDAHQVIRCVECQKKYRLDRRRQLRDTERVTTE